MAIYPPTPRFSDADKRLLALLGRLLLERVEVRQTLSNLPMRSVALSDAEAEELLHRITQLLSSKEFLEAAHFVEALTLGVELRRHMRASYIYQTVSAAVEVAPWRPLTGSSSEPGWDCRVRI
jgi:hypothetical protein